MFEAVQDDPVLIEVDSRIIRDLIALCASMALQIATGNPQGGVLLPSATSIASESFARPEPSMEAQSRNGISPEKQ